jgi:hypothetical protein
MPRNEIFVARSISYSNRAFAPRYSNCPELPVVAWDVYTSAYRDALPCCAGSITEKIWHQAHAFKVMVQLPDEVFSSNIYVQFIIRFVAVLNCFEDLLGLPPLEIIYFRRGLVTSAINQANVIGSYMTSSQDVCEKSRFHGLFLREKSI